MKKTLSIIAALCVIISAFSMFSVTASAATDKVSLYSSEVCNRMNGMIGTTVYVQTKDDASNQSVTLHYNQGAGRGWTDQGAEYVTTLEDGSKIWKTFLRSYDLEYVIKYEGDGEVTWDNNDGKNYKEGILGTAPIAVNRSQFAYLSRFTVNATVQNLGFAKDIKVRYTTDNWNTVKEAEMAYDKTNADGTEQWKAIISEDVASTPSFQFCVSYTVNGQTFWANNFGSNYDANFRIYP